MWDFSQCGLRISNLLEVIIVRCGVPIALKLYCRCSSILNAGRIIFGSAHNLNAPVAPWIDVQIFSGISCYYIRKSWKWPWFFAPGGQTNGFSQFKVYLVCLPMFQHRGTFSIGPCRPLPHAKLIATKLKIGTCRVKILVQQPNGGHGAPGGGGLKG